MTGKVKLPMGIEDFEEMRTMGYYYADKTGLIKTLLEHFREGQSVYTAKTFWQNAEHEHVKAFL